MSNKVTEKLKRVARDPETAITTALAVTAAGLAARKLAVVGWRALQGQNPPRDPSRQDVAWPTAIAWTSIVGVTVGMVRLATRRALSRH